MKARIFCERRVPQLRESLGEFNYRYNILSKCVSHVLSLMLQVSDTLPYSDKFLRLKIFAGRPTVIFCEIISEDYGATYVCLLHYLFEVVISQFKLNPKLQILLLEIFFGTIIRI